MYLKKIIIVGAGDVGNVDLRLKAAGFDVIVGPKHEEFLSDLQQTEPLPYESFIPLRNFTIEENNYPMRGKSGHERNYKYNK